LRHAAGALQGVPDLLKLLEPDGKAHLVVDVEGVRFRRPATGRFPIANIDAPAIFGREVIEARGRDLLAD
jgi:hypothetical protein